MDKQIINKAKRIFAAMLALTVMSATLAYTPLSGVFGDVAITANAASSIYLTDFLPVSASGTATGYSTYDNHFYKIEWSGINKSETTSVRLYIDGNYKQFRCYCSERL